jgi:hypothetical protein
LIELPECEEGSVLCEGGGTPGVGVVAEEEDGWANCFLTGVDLGETDYAGLRDTVEEPETID